MKEDGKLIGFLAERLEENLSGEPPRLDAILREATACARARSRVRYLRTCIWGGTLAAAVLAVICIFAVHVQPHPLPSEGDTVQAAAPQETSSSEVVVDVINILRAVDGDELEEEEEASEVEMLLAWQDAPYEDAVSGLFSENSPPVHNR